MTEGPLYDPWAQRRLPGHSPRAPLPQGTAQIARGHSRDQIVTVVEALLRTLCVRKGERFTAGVQWSDDLGVLIRVMSGTARAETAYVPIPLAAVAAFIGHDELPPKGMSTYADVLRFQD